MTLLPIVGRELRVASRKRGTYLPQIIGGTLGIGIDLVIFFVARQKLLANFRQTVPGAAGFGRPRRPMAPLLSAIPAPPPLP